jgi:ubiquinone/menaquinone biosynthesis C-methylase UbiE
MSKKYCRTEVYTQARPDQPKEMFVWLCEMLKHEIEAPLNILDIGAASGDFLNYAADTFPTTDCDGIEYDVELVKHCKKIYKERINISQGDANNLSSIENNTYSAVFMTGTHSIFDDFRASFSECIRVTKPNGIILITGLFNDYPLDARIHWRYPSNFEEDWHPGYNLFSKESITTYLSSIKSVTNFRFEKFVLPFDLEPSADPVRSWTEKTEDKERGFRNGIMPLNLELLMIYKAAATK